jgi:nitroreductase
MIRDLILKNRTYRRFYQDVTIEKSELESFIDLARLSSSGANLQPLKYIVSNDKEKNTAIFQNIKWAGYLTDWDGPMEGEKPSAYIIILGDTNISKNYWWDHGIASQSILLGAVEKGYGGCMFGAINKPELMSSLNIPEQYEVLVVIALGKPKEEVFLEDLKADGSIKYYRDENQVHHVPKRALKDVILDI